MIIKHIKIIALTLLTGLTILATTAVSAAQAEGPVKLILSSHIGWEVNKTTKSNICTLASKDQCQPGLTTNQPGGFQYPDGVTAAPNGNIYVADQGNHRVQELTADGEFVLMFGQEVNATTHGNICTEKEIETSKVTCKTGIEGTTNNAFAEIQDVAVDPTTGNVYVLDLANSRVDEYTPDGEFVLMVGKEVNETQDKTPGSNETQKNLCTATSKDTCKAGVRDTIENGEHGAFDFERPSGDVLSIGEAPEHLLYVADRSRIQEFNTAGEWKGELKLKPGITAATIDPETGNAYVVYNEEPIVHEVGTGTESEFEIPARQAGKIVEVRGIALDSSGHLAVSAREGTGEGEQFGYLYVAKERRLLTAFTIPGNLSEDAISGIGFNGKGELYVTVAAVDQELLRYVPEPVGEFVTESAECNSGPEEDKGTMGDENEKNDTFECTLHGEVNPYDVAETEAWFEWGDTCTLGSRTPMEAVATVELLLPLSAPVGGLPPNSALCYQLAGDDENVQPPEELTGNKLSLKTPIDPPKILGEPNTLSITSSSAVMHAEINPENSLTEAYFEYAPETQTGQNPLTTCKDAKKEHCPETTTTPTAEDLSVYGRVGTTLEASGLRPGTLYHYRLNADNLEETKNTLSALRVGNTEGQFTTAPAPKVEAQTGQVSAITPTSATIEGTINPDGQQATYTFEVGVNHGPATQFSVVLSNSTGANTTPETEQTTLTSLLPGVTYAYRITLHSGYGNAESTPNTFTTTTLPPVLNIPPTAPILEVPKFVFPKTVPACKPGFILNKQNKCVKTKQPRKKKKSKKKIKKTASHKPNK